MKNLPPEILAAIASGITSVIALIIRWIETRIFKAKIRHKEAEAETLQSVVDELKKQLGRSI